MRKLILLLTLALTLLTAGLAQAMDVTLAWDPNSEPDLAGYRIYYSTTAFASTDSVIPIPANRTMIDIPLNATGFTKTAPVWTVRGVSDAATVYFAVTAYDNEVPSLQSTFSNVVTANYADIFKGKAPKAPGALKIQSIVTTVSSTTVNTKVALYK